MSEANVGKILGLPVRQPPLRSSYVKDLEKCPRLFLLQDRVGIHKVGYTKALNFGTLVHKMLQELFLGRTEAEAKSATQHLCQITLDDLRDKVPPEEMERIALESDIDLWKAIAAASIFCQTNPFPIDRYSVAEFESEPLVEYLVGGGAIDLVLTDRQSGEVWIVDHKTTSMSPSVRVQALTISPQFQLYRRGLEERTKWQVAGVICNVIRTPLIKYCPDGKDSDHGFAGYLERLKAWYADQADPAMLQVFHRFSSDPLTEEEIDGRIIRYQQMAETEPLLPDFPRAGDYTCHDFNKSCPLLPFCTSDPSTWKDRLNGKGYEIKFREQTEE